MSYGSAVTLNADKAWDVTVSGLFKYEKGKLIDYNWKVPDVPEGYTFSQTVEGTKTTLIYVHRPAKKDPQRGAQGGSSLPSTGEATSPAVYAAVSCFTLAGALLLITVRRSKKKENR